MVDTPLKDIAWKSTGGTANRTFAERNAETYNVKDWGAVGDGLHDDRPNIQAAMDFCFPRNTGFPQICAKASLYFPPGDYRCSTFSQTLIGDTVNYGAPVGFGYGVLVLNYAVYGQLLYVHMFGDSSATTRIFYDGPIDTANRHSTTLFNIDSNVQRSLYEGLHFDMTPSGPYNDASINDPTEYSTLCAWNRGRPFSNSVNVNAGQNNIWRDCKFTGATFGLGLSGEGANLGSETLIEFCKFEDNARGCLSFSENALGYQVIGGYCKNNPWGGIIASRGVFAVVEGVEFENNGGSELGANHLGDVYSGNANPMYVVGCTSTSLDFMPDNSADVVLAGNYHNPPTVGGRFMYPNTARYIVMDGNYSTGGRIEFQPTPFGIYLKANRFDNVGANPAVPNYLSGGGNSYVFMPYRSFVFEPIDPGDHSFNLNY